MDQLRKHKLLDMSIFYWSTQTELNRRRKFCKLPHNHSDMGANVLPKGFEPSHFLRSPP